MVLSGPAQTVRLAASSRSAGPGFFSTLPLPLAPSGRCAVSPRCTVLEQAAEQLRNSPPVHRSPSLQPAAASDSPSPCLFSTLVAYFLPGTFFSRWHSVRTKPSQHQE